MNKLYQQMQTQQMAQNLLSPSNPVKQLMNTIRMAQNPQQYLTMILNQNPQMKSVVELVNRSGKNPKDLFYELAKQQGVDPNEILRALQ